MLPTSFLCCSKQFYNSQRRHSYLGYLTPLEFEKKLTLQKVALENVHFYLTTSLATQGVKTFIWAFCVLIIFRQVIMRNLQQITAYLQKLNTKHLDIPLKLDRKQSTNNQPDELEHVVMTINNMRIHLQQATSELEARVAERTSHLARSNAQLKNEIAERQKTEEERDVAERQLLQAQKLEAVGQLAAGIAHEINTPLQFIGDNTNFVYDSFREILEAIEVYEELINVAQEKNVIPESVAQTLQRIADYDLDFLLEQIPSALEETNEGVVRVTKIVSAMKNFSLPGEKEKSPADLNKAIENTTIVARNEWVSVANMKLQFDSDLPLVPCFQSEVNQALLNMIVNSAHAIGEVLKEKKKAKGEIIISTRQDGEFVEIRIDDTGGGIPDSVKDRIFEPFFTTKDVGKGAGQGLSVAYSIFVKKHGGTMNFESKMGIGTTFVIRLPL